MTVPLYNLTDTWNDGGTVFTAIKMDVTDTASAAESRLIDLQVGGTSFFNFAPVSGGSVRACLRLGNAATTGVLEILSGGRGFWTSGGFYANVFATDSIQFDLNTGNVVLGFDSGGGILAQRNGTNAQIFRVYNTYTDSSNYERLSLGWASNVLTLAMEKAGTGSNRAFQILGGAGTNLLDFAVTRPAGDSLTTALAFLVNNPTTYGVFVFDGTATFGGIGDAGTGAFALGTNSSPTLSGWATALTWTSAKNVVVNTAAIATNASDGFLYIPTCAGTPTGTPTGFTGRVPMIFDTTNSQFWFYTGGAWKQPKTPAGAATVTWQ